MKLYERAAQWVLDHVASASPGRGFRTVTLADPPAIVVPATLYLVGQPTPWCAVLRCPCGCHDTIHLDLLPDSAPRWTVQVRSDGKASVRPSIWRTRACRSHFFLREGRVQWCDDPEPRARRRRP